MLEDQAFPWFPYGASDESWRGSVPITCERDASGGHIRHSRVRSADRDVLILSRFPSPFYSCYKLHTPFDNGILCRGWFGIPLSTPITPIHIEQSRGSSVVGSTSPPLPLRLDMNLVSTRSPAHSCSPVRSTRYSHDHRGSTQEVAYPGYGKPHRYSTVVTPGHQSSIRSA